MKFLINGADNTAVVATTTYNFIAASHQSSWNTTETNRDTPVAGAMTLTGMVARFSTAPGVGETRTLTVMVDGTATAATVTVSGTDVQNSATFSVSVTAGQTISMRYTASAGAVSTTDQYWSILAESVTTDYFVMFGGSGTTNGVTAYQQLQNGTGTWLTSAADANQVMPLAGNITAWYVASTVAPGTGTDAWDISVAINGTPSAATVNYGAAETGQKSWTGTVALAAGDLVAMSMVETGTSAATAVAWSVVITPTTAGQSCIMFGNPDTPNTAATEYEQLFGGGNATWITTEANRYATLYTTTIQAIYAKVGTAPGALSDWTFQVREEAGNLTGASVVVSGTNTTGSSTGLSIAATSGNRYNWSCIPNVVPPATMTGGAHLGIQIFFEVGGTVVKDFIMSGFIPSPR